MPRAAFVETGAVSERGLSPAPCGKAAVGHCSNDDGAPGAAIIRAAALPIWLAALAALGIGQVAAFAQDMRPPRLTHILPDWNPAAADLRGYGLEEHAERRATEPAQEADAITRLNRATAELFPEIAASPVPVLLPFDTPAFLKDRAAGFAGKPLDDYLSGFHSSPFFLPGPSGYDAMFTVQASDLPGLGITFPERIEILISGLSLLYELDEPVGMIEWPPAKGPAADSAGVRHLFLENYARYAFTRYGIQYVVSILCFDSSTSRFHMISCREADKVAERFLAALHLVGGTAQVRPDATAPSLIARPPEASTDFTFHAPGDIMPGTGYRGQGGRADFTVYSKLRFPISAAPAFANSQSFMSGGDCNSTGRAWLGAVGGAPTYRCRVGGPVLSSHESAAANYSYPWRDNFCEHRDFDVGQCPGGLGHQGQDIRPGSCQQRMAGANRCIPYQHDVVAVRDGMVLRAAGQMPVYLYVNDVNEHIRFRYLHMLPRRLDEDGIVTGRRLAEGEELGKVGNFLHFEGATSYHLHFDMQVPTRYGWVFVNPYMTLVAGYERLIGGRGREVKDEPAATAAPALAGQDLPVLRAKGTPSALQSEGDDRIEGRDDEQARHTVPVPAKGDPDPRLGNGPPSARADPGAEHEGAVRPVGRELPRAGARARNLRRDLYAGHARVKAGHHRL